MKEKKVSISVDFTQSGLASGQAVQDENKSYIRSFHSSVLPAGSTPPVRNGYIPPRWHTVNPSELCPSVRPPADMAGALAGKRG